MRVAVRVVTLKSLAVGHLGHQQILRRILFIH